MSNFQPGILAAIPHYLSFSLKAGSKPRRAIASLVELADRESVVVGLGQSLVRALGGEISGMRVFPTQFGSGLILPSSSAALWCWLRGDDRGKLLHTGRRIAAAVSSAFDLESVIDGFMHATGRDLTGYVDGTENPKEELRRGATVGA